MIKFFYQKSCLGYFFSIAIIDTYDQLALFFYIEYFLNIKLILIINQQTKICFLLF